MTREKVFCSLLLCFGVLCTVTGSIWLSVRYAAHGRFSSTTCTVINVNISMKPCCYDEESWHQQSSHIFNETQENVSRRHRRRLDLILRPSANSFHKEPRICHSCYRPLLIVKWNTPKRPMEIVTMELYDDSTSYPSPDGAFVSGKQHVTS